MDPDLQKRESYKNSNVGKELEGHLGLLRMLVEFLDKKFGFLSAWVQNLIALMIALVLVVVLLSIFLSPTLVRGRLLIKESASEKPNIAKGYYISVWNEEAITNVKGNWMLPIYQKIPRYITIQIQDQGQTEDLGRYGFFGPWPILNTLFPPELELTVDKVEGKVTVSQRTVGETFLTTVSRWIKQPSAHAQVPPCSERNVPENFDIRPPSLVSPSDGGSIRQPYDQPWTFKWDYPSRLPPARYRICVAGQWATRPVIDEKTEQPYFSQGQKCSYVAESNLRNWKWKVRAQTKTGVWGRWAEGRFNVDRLDWNTFCTRCPDSPSCKRYKR